MVSAMSYRKWTVGFPGRFMCEKRDSAGDSRGYRRNDVLRRKMAAVGWGIGGAWLLITASEADGEESKGLRKERVKK
jgi:hypothetical protein